MQARPCPRFRAFTSLRSPLLALVAALSATPAHALTFVDVCRPTDTPFVCRLRSVLTLLYTAAGILILLLLIAVAAATFVYRRNARRLKIKDATPDAD